MSIILFQLIFSLMFLLYYDSSAFGLQNLSSLWSKGSRNTGESQGERGYESTLQNPIPTTEPAHSNKLPTLFQETNGVILPSLKPNTTINPKSPTVPLGNIIGTLINSAFEYVIDRNITKTIDLLIPILNKVLSPFGAELNLPNLFPTPEPEESEIEEVTEGSTTSTTTTKPCLNKWFLPKYCFYKVSTTTKQP